MILFPPAKINLGLYVLDQRTDGLHNIETCMVEIPITDVLEVIPNRKFEFITSGLSIPSSTEDNIIYKAYTMLKGEYNLPDIYCHLRKSIPMGAGLGGGSSDAAYMLKALSELFELNLSSEELKEKASKLGSDCSFFIEGGVQIGRGNGSELTHSTLDLSGLYLKIINNDIHVSTKDAYSNVLRNAGHLNLDVLKREMIGDWKGSFQNSFEGSVFALHPSLAEIKENLYEEGAIYSGMSGSGSTIFGIYEKKPEYSGGFQFERVVAL